MPRYKKETGDHFFKQLRQEVYAALGPDYRKQADRIILAKAGILVLCFSFGVLLLWSSAAAPMTYLCTAALLGISCLPLILNIGHEAVHRNLSTHPGINQLGRAIFYLLGTSPYFWEQRHIASHHSFPNVKEYDMDIEQSKLIRLSEAQAHEPHHRYQHWYMPFAFLTYTLVWFFFRDFKDLKEKQFGAKRIEQHPIDAICFLLLAKVWHCLFLILMPLLLGASPVIVAIGFFTFHFSASLITTFALISTHVGEHQEIMQPDANDTLPYDWCEHQLKTTADFSTKSKLLLHFFGGFNHHVAHHLFPNVPHILYPTVTKVIQRNCLALNKSYHSYPNLLACAKSHFKRLKAKAIFPHEIDEL